MVRRKITSGKTDYSYSVFFEDRIIKGWASTEEKPRQKAKEVSSQ